MATEERQWQYLTPAGDKRGPFPESTLMRMLVKKLPGLDSSSYCWTPGMEQWQPVGSLQHFHALLTAQAAAWYYVDKDGAQAGPVDVKGMAGLFQGGEIDGLTNVWHGELPGGWKPLSEVEELRTLMRLLVKNGEGEEEDEGEHAASEGAGAGAGAATAGAGAAADESDMVFEGEEQPALPPEMLKAKAKKGGEAAAAAAGGKKSYAGEDGVKYRFNEGTGEWEEALPGDEGESDEEEEDEEDEEEEDEEPRRDGGGATAGGGGGQQQQGVQGGAEKRKRKKKKKKSGWDKESNRWIYVTGLPVDVTPEELEAHFKQVGILAVDPETQQPRIKLYRDEQGAPKGDASIAYVRPESVELAIEILNGGLLRPNCPVTISKAVFQQKAAAAGAGGATKRRKVAESKIKVARAAAKQALSWADEDDTGVNRSKALRIVVIKNMFHPKETAAPGFVEELQEDLDGECGRLGPIEKMTVFERHPEGVVILKYGTAYAAEQCVKLMNNRFFAGRKLQCFYWDGATDFTKAVYVERPPAATAATAAAAAAAAAAAGSSGGSAAQPEAASAATSTATVMDEEAEEEARLEAFGEELDNQELPPEFALEVEGD